ncbi:hypothetical protein SAMN05216410_3169 [Sanguibacter gelidistatuariae]|uniref:Helicase HerA central domain-containing protein n=1 Tax=Sanguibacter gelidistatuariae TaxID=1814289 RepID=A0A1G6TQN0_9MICO|nr:ATP-binding protein [Sanguibacter gelidistatuariae]SDD31413.1 hypothetical protein SAMN05216410_3169 [Sanguibacter gelidistatuariae]
MIQIGQTVDSEGGTAAELDVRRFNRHTFWCGQSGSGKTYALGVVLEQLLLHTRLPMLILDPNADFVRMSDVHQGIDPVVAAQLADADVRILRSGDAPGERLVVRFRDLGLRSKAAVLRLDPLLDAEEYNVLLHLDEEISSLRQDKGGLVDHLRAATDPGRRKLLLRLENLGIMDWDLWAWGGRSAEDIIDTRPRAAVLDLSGFRSHWEPKVAALAVLDHLWGTREARQPALIVIDEAHNLCSADPVTPVDRALTERIVQIAAEGRKYGLWLLLSTQRPSKIHPNALSQCDNLALMKMSSPHDLAELADYFGYAPADLLARSPRFLQGQALFAGGFVDRATVVQMGSRLTHEGGTDVPVPI